MYPLHYGPGGCRGKAKLGKIISHPQIASVDSSEDRNDPVELGPFGKLTLANEFAFATRTFDNRQTGNSAALPSWDPAHRKSEISDRVVTGAYDAYRFAETIRRGLAAFSRRRNGNGIVFNEQRRDDGLSENARRHAFSDASFCGAQLFVG